VEPRIDMLILLLDQAFDHRAWHGTTLKGSIRGLKLSEAVWRPRSKRHNIWEIILHTAYWKYAVRRTLTGEPRGGFPRTGSNWPDLPNSSTTSGLKADVAILKAQHLRLREAIAGFEAKKLKSTPKGLKWRYEQYIYGAASHDLYHAGQIQLIKRLQSSNSR
jgi:hypothetical protein